MTTNTPSQAASIMAAEFCDLLFAYHEASPGGHAQAALVAHIDTKLAQAREEGRRDSHETNMAMLNLKLKAEDRAIAAESRLAEIQRGVEGLTRYQPGLRWGVTGFEGGLSLISRNEVLALLQPQGQASDTNGLPG